MERTIFVNWRWEGNNSQIRNGLNEKCRELIVDENKASIVFSWLRKKESIDETENLKKIISTIDSKSKLILLHHDNGILPIDLKDLNLICQSFDDGRGPIYFQNGGLVHTGDNYKNIDNWIAELEKFNVLKEIFNKLWGIYTIEDQKKKLINLWLPLAIDIQGLSEVQSDTQKAEEYFNEIKNENEYLTSLLSFGKEEDFPRWQEIIEELMKEAKTKPYAEFNPISIVDELKKENQTFDSFKNNDAKYLENKNGDILNPNFLPNWLQEVVSVIDLKISENK